MAFIDTFQASTQVTIAQRAIRAGLVDLPTTLAIVGAKTASGTGATNTALDVLDELDGDTTAGIGSEAAQMNRWVRAALQDAGITLPVKMVLLADAGGTARVVTLGLSGTVSAASDYTVRVGHLLFTVTAAITDTPTTLQAAMQTEINDAAREHGFTALASVGNLAFTAKNTGVNANAVPVTVVAAPTGLTPSTTETTAGVGATDITNALAAIAEEDIQYIAIANNQSADVTDVLTHITATWSAQAKRWRWIGAGEQGLVASDTYAAAANDRAAVIACAKNSYLAPANTAAYTMARIAAVQQSNQPMDNLVCTSYPMTPARLTTSEIETYGPRGVLLLDWNVAGNRMRFVRAVTTATTIGGVPDDSQLDITTSRTLVELARQCDTAVESNFTNDDGTPVLRTETTPGQMIGVCLGVARAMEATNELRNVDELRPLFRAVTREQDPSLADDTVRLEIPASVVPALRNKQIAISLYA